MTDKRKSALQRLWHGLGRRVLMAWLIFLVGACASSPAAPDKGGVASVAVVPAAKTGLFTGPPDDAVMINEGASWLVLSDKPADYKKARDIFEDLITRFPKSRWRPLAETFLRLIDTLEPLQAKSIMAQELADKLKEDNERLKKEIQTLANRFQTERAALLLENEQLKKDIELLKQLEVQLDKREKMLR